MGINSSADGVSSYKAFSPGLRGHGEVQDLHGSGANHQLQHDAHADSQPYISVPTLTALTRQGPNF